MHNYSIVLLLLNIYGFVFNGNILYHERWEFKLDDTRYCRQTLAQCEMRILDDNGRFVIVTCKLT